MKPKLIDVSGFVGTKFIYLPEENNKKFLIGRNLNSNLPLKSNDVSRKHCAIVKDDENFLIKDLDSHNGTFVNNKSIKNHILKDGDKISIGNIEFVFVTDNKIDLNRAVLDDGSLVTQSSIQLFPNVASKEFSADLFVLIRFGEAINEIKSTKLLQREFLKIILEVMPAEKGAILLTNEDINDAETVSYSKNGFDGSEVFKLSRTVCEKVFGENVALLSNNLNDKDLLTSESLNVSKVQTLLCVPLKVFLMKGLIYLTSSKMENQFSEKNLEQLTAISYIISAALENTELLADLKRENQFLKEELSIETNIIGKSKKMKEIFYLISRFSQADSTVLITGESGTGKELVAQTIHQNSSRKNKPFVAVNCAVLNENLLESELFGYEKGAFTGATNRKKGKLEIAEGGTVFLDEIGELDVNLQAKLLRFLQEREFERVGGTKKIRPNVRILAATNRNLEEEIKLGNFRNDLYFRLNVLKIKIPPLKERKDDVLLLAQYFIKKHNSKSSLQPKTLTPQAIRILQSYDWSGNVRELENVIERAIIMAESDRIEPKDLPAEISQKTLLNNFSEGDFYQQVKKAKVNIILQTLRITKKNYTEAAEKLGVHPNNLHRIIRNLEIKEEIDKIL